MIKWIQNKGCKHPGCDEKEWPKPDIRCICRQPMYIFIANGSHIHINCPVHGDVKIHGSPIVHMSAHVD